MRSDKKDVMSVPTKKGSIPKRLETGSHVFPHKKPKPFALIAGQEEINNVIKNIISNTMVVIAAMLSHLTKILFSNILQRFFIFLTDIHNLLIIFCKGKKRECPPESPL